MHGGMLKIRVAAPPVENAANRALIEFVAHRLGIPPRRVRIAAGGTGRRKVLEIEGETAERIAAILRSGESA